ncbi:hypothetical protein AB0K81_16915 [Streptomyces werraensis]|uniref:Uncharacterized protein n=1 Tax=Streptomyces werraensis TaxID=68284 RepID=A0ABV3JGF3_9ACTN
MRELAASWERARPHLDRIREPFAQHAAVPGGWVYDFDAFVDLLTQWGDVLTERTDLAGVTRSASNSGRPSHGDGGHWRPRMDSNLRPA